MYMLNELIALLCIGVSLSSAFNVLAFYDGKHDQAHINFVNEAIKWFPQQSTKNNFQFNSTTDWSLLSANNFKNYQVILFLDWVPHDNAQREEFQKYMENGGAWMGFHYSAFVSNAKEWPWYHNTLLGTGLFVRNTWWPTSAKLHIEAPDHPIMKGIPDKFMSCVSEWYEWRNDLRKNPDITVLATIDNSSFPVGTDPDQSWYSGYYPILWSHKKYKMVYANFGHNYMDYDKDVGLSSTFASDDQNKFLFQALNWLANE